MSSLFKRTRKKLFEKSDKKIEESDFLSPSLPDNLTVIKQQTGNSQDIVIRPLKTEASPVANLAIVYVDGIVDAATVNEFIFESIMANPRQYEGTSEELLQHLADNGVALGSLKTVQEWKDLFQELMDGNTIVLINGTNQAISAGTKGGEHRSVEQPESQVTVRGPRDGFNESIQTNIALVRRRIRNPNLWTESMKIGRMTKTNVTIMYLKGAVNEKIVDEVRNRLNTIDIDSILESGYIEQLVEDQTWTSFPTLYHTERPDTVAGNILEGRIAIFVDGTPFVLLAPAVFIQFFQAAEDYYMRFDIATALPANINIFHFNYRPLHLHCRDNLPSGNDTNTAGDQYCRSTGISAVPGFCGSSHDGNHI